MHVFRNLGEIPQDFGSTVVSIGNFDGVHLGHQFILERLRQSAAARSSRSVAVTFDPHPLRFLRPETCPKLITPLETRLELLGDAGVDAVLVLSFTAELSRMRAAEFVTTIVRNALRAVEIHEGTNFRFGYRAEGGTAELSELGRKKQQVDREVESKNEELEKVHKTLESLRDEAKTKGEAISKLERDLRKFGSRVAQSKGKPRG